MGKIRKRGENWVIDYRVYGKRYRETIGSNRKLAEQVLHKRMLEIAEGRFLDKKKDSKVKFFDFAQEYIELYSKTHKKSWDKDITRLKPLKQFFGNRLLCQITPLEIQTYIHKRINGEICISKSKVSHSTVNRELACLKHMFTKAIEWGKVEVNPVKKVKLFQERNQRIRYLEEQKIEKLLNNSKGYLRRIIILALNTGMRKGEILSLKWNDIDFKNNTIHLLDTKNGEKREIPINDSVRKALIEQRKYENSSYMFCNSDGKPFRDVRKSFLAALKKSDIINFRFHDLRHTFASQLVMSGVDLNTVRDLMGHKSMRMTLRYAHLSPAHKKRAVDILEQKWSQSGHNVATQQGSQISDPKKALTIKNFFPMPR